MLDKIIKKYYSDIKISPHEKGKYFDNMSKTFNIDVKDICDLLFDFKFKSKDSNVFPTIIYTYEDFEQNYIITHEKYYDGYWSIKYKCIKTKYIFYFENNFDNVNHTLF